jgi:hypothetical protein
VSEQQPRPDAEAVSRGHAPAVPPEQPPSKETTKVTLLVPISQADAGGAAVGPHGGQVGDVVELPVDVAERWVAAGLAGHPARSGEKASEQTPAEEPPAEEPAESGGGATGQRRSRS